MYSQENSGELPNFLSKRSGNIFTLFVSIKREHSQTCYLSFAGRKK